MVLVLAIEENEMHTSRIPNLGAKLETALPGILPKTEDRYVHMCGTDEQEHDFREEVESGTTVPHLLEHVILHLLGRSSGRCSGFSGQRSSDLKQGITNHYYVVTDYSDKVQATVAADLAIQLVSAWMADRTVRLDAEKILEWVDRRLAAMLCPD